MRRVAILLATCLALAGCGSIRERSAPSQPDGATATLTRDSGSGWLLEYRFAHAAPAWFFVRSALDLDGKPWRARSFTVETPGVRLERQGRYDVLVGDATPLSSVRIRVRPFPESISADYTPALAFSDGGIAFYSEHHLVAPLPSAAAAAALPPDLNGVEFETVPLRFTLRDPGRNLLFGGKRLRGEASLMLNGDDAYLYSGAARPVETPAFVGIIDPGLPQWVTAELHAFTPRLFDYYTDRLGKPRGDRPTALVAWGGAELKGYSVGGSVLKGMVVMNMRGAQVASPNPAVRTRMRSFIGHEAAHFWLGQTVRYGGRSEAWITEGAADLMAFRAFKHLDPGYDDRADLQRSIDDCLKVNGTKPLGKAAERGEHRASYACGAVLALAAEGAARKRDLGADIFTWLKHLIDANRADGVVTQADWLDAFAAVRADPAVTAAVRHFLDEGTPDPGGFVYDLLAGSGVAVRREGERVLL
jgi:uncharacterized protein YceK